VRVTEAEKLTEAIDKALQFKGPALVEIITDADLI
jgi:thiamine pyrophosphate-dependent acetolactate synthase large subunit-like protein